MKTIAKYVNELTGKEFLTEVEALKSENKTKDIRKLFSFWESPKDDGTSKFANGEWCYQRTKKDYKQFVNALIKAIKKYEPWIAKQYHQHGGLQPKHMGSGFMIGRYLDDSNSELYTQYLKLSCVCMVCFREWGQPYYSSHCTHSIEPRKIS